MYSVYLYHMILITFLSHSFYSVYLLNKHLNITRLRAIIKKNKLPRRDGKKINCYYPLIAQLNFHKSK